MAKKDKEISHRGKYFLRTLEREDRKKFKPYVKSFELSCILSSLEESLMVIPFPVEEKYLEEFQAIHNYIRQLIVARLGERMLFEAVYKDDKSGKESASVLIKRMTTDPTEEGNGGFALPPNINVNFVKAKD